MTAIQCGTELALSVNYSSRYNLEKQQIMYNAPCSLLSEISMLRKATSTILERSQRLANGHTVRYALAAWTVEPHLQFPTTM